MPLTSPGAALGGGIISGITGLVGLGISAQQQQAANQAQRDFEEHMYDKSLFNNRLDWQMQNMYNAPEAQMQRLKLAGLNPNLVYGNGATAMGGSISSSSPSVSNSTRTGIDARDIQNIVPGALSAIYDTRLKSAQANLTLEEAKSQIANRSLMNTQAALNDAVKNKTNLETALGKDQYNDHIQQLALANRKALADIQNINTDTGLKTSQIGLTNASTQSTIDENRRKWLMNDISLAQALQNIVESKSRVQLNQSSIGLNQSHTDLNKTESLIKKIDLAYKQRSGDLNNNPQSSGLNKAIDIAMQGIAKGSANIMDWLHDIYLKIQGYDHY